MMYFSLCKWLKLIERYSQRLRSVHLVSGIALAVSVENEYPPHSCVFDTIKSLNVWGLAF